MCVVAPRCDAAYGGPQCDQLLDFNILYVVPSGQKLHYVLIAAIIGAVQVTVIAAVVMCFTRYVPTHLVGGAWPSQLVLILRKIT